MRSRRHGAQRPRNERLLLEQRDAMQMTVVALGARHGVNASTISRWIADARPAYREPSEGELPGR